MKEILDRIGTYNIFNFLFPGVVFSALLTKFTPFSLIQDDVLVGAFVYYFIGLVVSRIGSLIIEPILKKTGFISFSSYDEFVNASKKDEKIELLSEINNMYRTFCSLFVCTAIVYCYGLLAARYTALSDVLPIICIIGLLLLFTFSYKKQTRYINSRISMSKNRSGQ